MTSFTFSGWMDVLPYVVCCLMVNVVGVMGLSSLFDIIRHSSPLVPTHNASRPSIHLGSLVEGNVSENASSSSVPSSKSSKSPDSLNQTVNRPSCIPIQTHRCSKKVWEYGNPR